MTLLVSWVGIDTHGIASAYIAADSRISWECNVSFDHARKIFALQHSPDILGYCGDVLFPTMVLSQIAEMADRNLLFPPNASCKERFELIKETLVHQFQKYPEGKTANYFKVLHISRDLNDNSKFECRFIEWSHSKKKNWSGGEIAMPSHSDVLLVMGTGRKEFYNNMERYGKGVNRGTSRSIFHCFCDTLFNINDANCGGVPQLAGIFRKPNSAGITFGIITRKARFFLGGYIGKNVNYKCIDWRNDLFEICDGKKMKRLDDAQSQPDNLRRKLK